MLDYLSEEVLSRQPAPAQQFFLHSSILERLSGPFYGAVREQGGSQAMLEVLERANLSQSLAQIEQFSEIISKDTFPQRCVTGCLFHNRSRHQRMSKRSIRTEQRPGR